VSQISAGSRTTPGGYQHAQQNQPHAQQFSLHDPRSLLEVIKDVSRLGNCPSFCTACYRLGRTGEDFMNLAKPGEIQNFCLPNAILTYQEYLLDYGDQEAKNLGKKVIEEHLAQIKNEKIREITIEKLKRLEMGERDLYF
ncbi:MAG: [FeFe] hydrogenase H-cluster radical SAM maturase HydG, partial [Candidatus Margulisiibacteriota bacterium]